MEYLSITLLILIAIALGIHRYLSIYWENGQLPYPAGFLIYAHIFLLLQLVNFIWIFGFIVGVGVFIASFFQVLFISIIWPLLAVYSWKTYNSDSPVNLNERYLAHFSFIVPLIGLLTVVNFFISDYKNGWIKLIELLSEKEIIIGAIGLIVLGNTLRILFLSILSAVSKR